MSRNHDHSPRGREATIPEDECPRCVRRRHRLVDAKVRQARAARVDPTKIAKVKAEREQRYQLAKRDPFKRPLHVRVDNRRRQSERSARKARRPSVYLTVETPPATLDRPTPQPRKRSRTDG